jgi:hypothetical protein
VSGEAWDAVVSEVTLNDDGTVTLRWALAGESDQVAEEVTQF